MIMDENNNEQEVMEMLEDSFIQTTQEYLQASAQLAEATSLCGDDPIKKDMISFITEDFLKLCARSEGIRVMAQDSYNENREFIISEMKEVTALTLEIAQQVRAKLEPLG
jgi:hypothetical protein